jgi:hypothetical protein
MMSTDGFEDAPVTDSDKRQRGEVKGTATCFTRRGKCGEGERKEMGARRRWGGTLLQGRHGRAGDGGRGRRGVEPRGGRTKRGVPVAR